MATLGILSGLSLFLYGMNLMSEGLENISKNKLFVYVKQLTDSKFYSFILGIILTAIIQSSSALSVILIGLLNVKAITYHTAVWMIMGAEIGTTITGHLFALDISFIAPFLSIIGVVLYAFHQYQRIGQSILGVSFIFIGLDMMSLVIKNEQLQVFFTVLNNYISNPFLVMIIGCLFTVLIQSSSASIGIFQSLLKQNVYSFFDLSYVVLGLNLGTCITSFIASLHGERNAKRLCYFQILYNLIGICLFYPIYRYSQFLNYVFSYSHSSSFALAHIHSLFNIGTTIFIVLLYYCLKYILKIK